MKPGDLVRFTHHASILFTPETCIGVLLSSCTTKWDRSIVFYRFLTSTGVREVILGTKGISWEVVS